MKKILVLALVIVGGYFLSGYSTFSQANVGKFLGQLEDDIVRGDADSACAKMGEKISFSLNDKSTNPPKQVSGGKETICDYFSTVARIYKTAPIADRFYKSDLTVKRDLFNWKTATISFTEHHSTEFFPSHMVVKTISQEQMTLQKRGDTFTILSWKADVEIEQ